jgi:hypothetical protein
MPSLNMHGRWHSKPNRLAPAHLRCEPIRCRPALSEQPDVSDLLLGLQLASTRTLSSRFGAWPHCFREARDRRSYVARGGAQRHLIGYPTSCAALANSHLDR